MATIYENTRLRVTIPDGNLVSKEAAMTLSMRALEHIKLAKDLEDSGATIDVLSIQRSIKDQLMYEYLEDIAKYDAYELLDRVDKGRILSEGQQRAWSEASAYASGFLEPLDNGSIYEEASNFLQSDHSKTQRAAFFKNLFLKKGSHEKASKLAEMYEKELQAIEERHQRDIDYSKGCAKFIKDWKVEIIGKMPKNFPQSGTFGGTL